MNDATKLGVINFYDTHPINEDEILVKAGANGASLDNLSELDLKDFDQDHYGGTDFLDALADHAGIENAIMCWMSAAAWADPQGGWLLNEVAELPA